MNCHNSLERLSALIAMICFEDYRFTIRRAANELGIGIKIVREDMIRLAENSVFAERMVFGEEVLSEIDTADALHRIEEGSADDIVIGLQYDSLFGFDRRQGHYDPMMLPMTYLEHEALEQFIHEDAGGERNSLLNLSVKYTVYDLPSHERYIMEYIQDALETGSALRFVYADSRGVIEEKRGIQPIHILRHTAENLYYFFDSNGLIYRLDRISDINYDETLTESMLSVNEDSCLNPNVWGVNDFGEEPVFVRISIRNETPNLLDKIRQDTATRENGRLYRDNAGKYFYEDIISGYSDFKRWLRSYGSSFKVLEPSFIADDMLLSALAVLKAYDTGEFPDMS